MTTYKIPKKLETIPKKLLFEGVEEGRLEELYYGTYDSFTYETTKIPLRKRVLVYVPANYDENKKYNVVYISHGGWSTESTTLGDVGRENSFKKDIDKAIQNGEIEPMIIVCVTYNNRSSRDSWDYSLAIQLTYNFYRELVNDIIPAVESKYSTYATSIEKEDLKKSRKHRAFVGFSMGSVNTWRTFENALDYFYYFVPMSGNVNRSRRDFEDIVKEKRLPFFIFAMSGDRDFAYNAFKNQVLSLEGEYFKFGNNEEEGNIAFREMPGYSHDKLAADTYTYNALKFLWKNK